MLVRTLSCCVVLLLVCMCLVWHAIRCHLERRSFFFFHFNMLNSLSILSMSFSSLSTDIEIRREKKLISNLHSIHSKFSSLILHYRRPFGLAFFFFVFDFLCSIFYWTQMQIPYTLHYILNIQWISRWLSNISVIDKRKFIKHEMGFMFILSIFTSGHHISNI